MSSQHREALGGLILVAKTLKDVAKEVPFRSARETLAVLVETVKV